MKNVSMSVSVCVWGLARTHNFIKLLHQKRNDNDPCLCLSLTFSIFNDPRPTLMARFSLVVFVVFN